MLNFRGVVPVIQRKKWTFFKRLDVTLRYGMSEKVTPQPLPAQAPSLSLLAVMMFSFGNVWMFSNNRGGKPPKWKVKNNGKPYFLMDDLGYHNFWKHPYGNVFPFYTKKCWTLAKFWGTKGCRKPVPMLECWTRRVRQEQVDASFASQHLGFNRWADKMELTKYIQSIFSNLPPFWFVSETWVMARIWVCLSCESQIRWISKVVKV